ncbi:MAG: hypothetical protein LBN05_01495 [Oscillospiraceae bacterium]|jgi:hypothetical protein|nr:hypothetical protein [Oscillospiraceae bacterium]
MKKTLAALAAVVVLLLTLVACDPKQPENPTTNPNDTPATTASGDAYTFKTAEGLAIPLGVRADAILAALGTPLKTRKEPSCAFEGEDKFYAYAGFEVSTYPDKGTDYFYTVSLRDDSVQTPEGVRIGSTLAEMETAYGKAASAENDVYKYMKNSTTLSFALTNNVVTQITYEWGVG